MRKLWLGFICSLWLGTAHAASPYSTAIKVGLPATVTIFVTELWVTDHHIATGTVLGSGTIISPNGQILSCAHLFERPHLLRITSVETADGSIYSAEVLNVDFSRDLSLLRINIGTAALHVSIATTTPDIGDQVIAIGSPLGMDGT